MGGEGSSTMFQFSPVLGEHVVDVLEQKQRGSRCARSEWPEAEESGEACNGGQGGVNDAVLPS